jgi:hypothetical protein
MKQTIWMTNKYIKRVAEKAGIEASLDKKLEPCIYKIKTLHKDDNVGNCQIKLK